MRSLRRKFNNISEKKPYWSSYICFAEAVKNQGFNRRTINQWFNTLINKDDYDKNEKKELIRHLSKLSNSPDNNLK